MACDDVPLLCDLGFWVDTGQRSSRERVSLCLVGLPSNPPACLEEALRVSAMFHHAPCSTMRPCSAMFRHVPPCVHVRPCSAMRPGMLSWYTGARSVAPCRRVPDLSGVWIKDREASDLVSYERALTLMRLGRLQKITALNLIEVRSRRQTGHAHAARSAAEDHGTQPDRGAQP
jgi:hypothetical protein